MKHLSLLLLFLSTLLLSACLRMYGIKPIQPLTNTAIQKQASKFQIPAKASFVLDSQYRQLLTSFDTSLFAQQINNHAQPLQALYYNKSGQLLSFQINCYAGGFPNLKWNRDGNFQSFPPKVQAPIDSLISLPILLSHLNPIEAVKVPNPQDAEYFVVVFWSKFMGRQSQRFIQLVKENSQTLAPSQTQIIYVNTDNFFIP